MDALYFRISTDRQTTEDQFEDLLQVAEKDESQRNWDTIRGRLFRYVIKSQTGPINSAVGRLLWAIQAWFAEMENGERSEAIRAGLARARATGKRFGRPRTDFDYSETVLLRQENYSWRGIAAKLGVGTGTVRRV
jgi:DNA invertase Pin-like site-specific DNA recombinase